MGLKSEAKFTLNKRPLSIILLQVDFVRRVQHYFLSILLLVEITRMSRPRNLLYLLQHGLSERTRIQLVYFDQVIAYIHEIFILALGTLDHFAMTTWRRMLFRCSWRWFISESLLLIEMFDFRIGRFLIAAVRLRRRLDAGMLLTRQVEDFYLVGEAFARAPVTHVMFFEQMIWHVDHSRRTNCAGQLELALVNGLQYFHWFLVAKRRTATSACGDQRSEALLVRH